MIDWITAELPITHEPLAHGLIQKITEHGEIEWETPCRHNVTGSWESSVSIRSTGADGDGLARYLQFSGNPSKFLQGHNVIGTDDLIPLMQAAILKVFSIVGLDPTWQEADRIASGAYKVTRVDINYMYSLPTQSDVVSWIRAAEYSSRTRHGRPQSKGGTLYWGKNSRRWAIKAYSKFDEIKKHKLPEELLSSGLNEYAESKLRLEVVLRGMELKDRGIASAVGICEYGITRLFSEYLGKIEMAENMRLSTDKMNNLPNRLLGTYKLWCHGEVLSESLSKATYYRHRKELLAYGVDIMTVRPATDRSNVIPLIRVLEARPCSTPESLQAYCYPALLSSGNKSI